MPARTLPLSALLAALQPHRPRVGRAVRAHPRAKDSYGAYQFKLYLLSNWTQRNA